MDELPNIDYMHSMCQTATVLAVRPHSGDITPCKRQNREFNISRPGFRVTLPKVPAPPNSAPLDLPPEFISNPQFNFIPPTNVEFPSASTTSDGIGVEPMDFLVNILTPAEENQVEEAERSPRPLRIRSQPVLYQSEEVDKEEKGKRHKDV